MEPPVKKCHPCQCTSQEAGSVSEDLKDSAQHEEADISATFTETLSILNQWIGRTERNHGCNCILSETSRFCGSFFQWEGCVLWMATVGATPIF